MPTALRLLSLIAMLALAWPALAADLTLDDCLDPTPGQYFTPAPWRPEAPSFNLATACVGEPYSQIISIWNPSEVTLNGLAIPLYATFLPTSGGIRDLPGGLTYHCAPPNCFFPLPGAGGSGHSYCIEIFGTPSALNPTPATHDLEFEITVDTPFGDIPLDYPSAWEPDAHVYLKLEPAGNCPEPDATVASFAVLGVLAALARRRNGRTGV
jgi:hypothetical protein